MRDFWGLWLRAALVIALGAAFYLHLPAAHAATMRASFYGGESGRLNADGSRFEPMGFTAAHRSLPFGTRLEACYRACVVVTVRDRGPAAWTGRALDLARGAARAIGLEARGVADISVRVIGGSSDRLALHHYRNRPGRRRMRNSRRPPNHQAVHRTR